ncbi:MAG TPA: zinc dependent phospholipase C family protein [Acidobacteriaceae bacterium]|nr:zinc dependent phospholipase C family protein [Acidobacteriaceae bacterium]
MKGRIAWVGVAGLLLVAPLAFAFSFLTHETIIDITWVNGIKPVLLAKYPNTTEKELETAHAFAYGGCVIQDAGYYPFGHPPFSNLAHYVRTGDFITNLIHQAHNVNELAFALGALSHYVGDSIGHREAVNPSVAIEFPDLEKEYGPVVTYEQDPHAHIRTEWAFDIDQLSHARFAPAVYLRNVGFQVPVKLLERAFYATYGLRLNKIVGHERHAIASYDWAVRQFLPRISYAEVLLHRKSFPPDQDLPGFHTFAERVKKASVDNGWEQYRKHKVSFKTRIVAFLILITPKIGILSDLAIRGPSRESEENYVEAVNATIDRYQQLLGELAQKGNDGFAVPDLDLDTGYPTRPGTYRLTDKTYATLLHEVTEQNAMPPLGLRQNILAYYSNPNAPIETKKHPKKWAKVQKELEVLRSMPATRIPEAK